MAEPPVYFFEHPDFERQVLDEIERRQLRYRAALGNYNEGHARRATDIASRHPHMRAGVTTAMAAFGLSADDPVVEELAKRSAQADAEDNGGWSVGSFVKGVVRGAATIAESAFEEVISRPTRAAVTAVSERDNWNPVAGFMRPEEEGSEVLSAVERSGPSTAAIAARQFTETGEVDLGSGFLSGGSVRREFEARAEGRLPADLDSLPPSEQVKLMRQAERAPTFRGQPISPGRVAAVHAFEPGTKPYSILSGLLDASAQIALDPTAIAAGGIAKAAKARKVFTNVEAGAVNGLRKTILGTNADEWLLKSDDGQRVVNWLTEQNDFEKVWRALGKTDRKVALNLTDATATDEVIDVLRGALGTAIRERPTPGRIGRAVGSLAGETGATFGLGTALKVETLPRFQRRLSDVRLLSQMPGDHLSVDSIDDALETLDRYMTNAQMPAAVKAERLTELARIDEGDATGVYQVAAKVMDDIGEQLTGKGASDRHAGKLTEIVDDFATDLRAYYVDEIGNPASFPGAKRKVLVDGTEETLPTAHLLTEYMQRAVPLPDARAIRSAQRVWRPLFDRLPGNMFEDSSGNMLSGLHEFIVNDVWKPIVLMRGAWFVRVVGEEQVRMAAAGLDSLIRHPASWIAYRIGRKGATDLGGEVMDDAAEFASAMSRGTAGFRRAPPGQILTGDYVKVRKGDDNFVDAWAGELSQLWNDRVSREVADGRASLDEVKEWFWRGPGSRYRERLGNGGSGKQVLLNDRAAADEYIDTVWARIRVKTGDDPDLIESIATGQLDGKTVRGAAGFESGKIAKTLRDRVGVAPDVVKGERSVFLTGRFGQNVELLQRWDRFVERAFDSLMSKRTNNLSRSPAFKQFYWQRAEELLPFADEATQRSMYMRAQEANLDRSTLSRWKSLVGSGSSDVLTDVEQADTLAKAFGLTETKRLLYDVTEKSQWGDELRNFIPFPDAWQEIVTHWTKQLASDPVRTFRRGQQTVEGARGSGVFYTDPVSGQEVFGYPGGGLISKWMFGEDSGASLKLQGSVHGLNLFAATMLPGLGPTAQLPVSYLMPDRPEWDTLTELLLPFGKTEPGSIGEFIDSALTPAWAKKWVQAFDGGTAEMQRLSANTTFDVAKALHMSGDYSTATPQEYQRLLEDAKHKKTVLYLIRGALQWGLPTGPQIRFEAEDTDGNWLTFQALADEYRELEEETGDSYEAAVRFSDKFGFDPLLIQQAKSKGLRQRSVTKTGADWERSHPELVEAYPDVVGYFAPTPDADDFDWQAYSRQFESGDRAELSPEQMVLAANNAKGWAAYRHARSKVEGRNDPASKQWIRSVYEQLKVEYPGFPDATGIPEGASMETRIGQLVSAADDEAIAGTDAGQGLRLYLKARDQAVQSAEELGLSASRTKQFTEAKAAAHLRNWLRAVGTKVAEEHPDFRGMWDYVWSRELKDDLLEQPETELPEAS